MKLFINDWNGDRDSFIMNVEENREYPINAWISTEDGRQIYLVSAYVYDDFVMFFYIYEKSTSHEDVEGTIFKSPQTNRDLIIQSQKNFNHISFKYEVNHLNTERGSGRECLRQQRPENMPVEEKDEFLEMYYGEYDYLCDIMKDRVPEELQKVDIAFRKDCFSFAEPVTEIEHIAIYPSSHEARRHFIDETFTVPYGECDIKIPYSAYGTQSYIIIKELKIIDMLQSFEKNYEEFRKVRENTLKQLENNNKTENQTVIDLDEMRQHWDKRILTVSYLKQEERRSFDFYTTEYLNSKIATFTGGLLSTAYIFVQDKEDRMVDGLYKGISTLGEVPDNPNTEYEITLMWASEPVERERKAIFQAQF